MHSLTRWFILTMIWRVLESMVKRKEGRSKRWKRHEVEILRRDFRYEYELQRSQRQAHLDIGCSQEESYNTTQAKYSHLEYSAFQIPILLQTTFPSLPLIDASHSLDIQLPLPSQRCFAHLRPLPTTPPSSRTLPFALSEYLLHSRRHDQEHPWTLPRSTPAASSLVSFLTYTASSPFSFLHSTLYLLKPVPQARTLPKPKIYIYPTHIPKTNPQAPRKPNPIRSKMRASSLGHPQSMLLPVGQIDGMLCGRIQSLSTNLSESTFPIIDSILRLRRLYYVLDITSYLAHHFWTPTIPPLLQ